MVSGADQHYDALAERGRSLDRLADRWLPADRFGFGQAHPVAAAILAAASLILTLSPFRRARVT